MEERDYAHEYGVRCRQIRMAKGLSQQKLADMINVTPQAISKWEKEGVRDVNIVQRLSNVLGQDITADQIDQEGSVGEVGREILNVLVKNEGFVDFDVLLDGLYGMSKDRVSNELFKLERIGTVVREQYTDFRDEERDTIMITAKGLIAYKNSKENVDRNLILGVKTWEMQLSDGYSSIQELIDDDPVSKILWNLSFDDYYRIDYLVYLHKNYKAQFPMKWDYNFQDYPYVGGKNCFVDILCRMVRGLDDEDILEFEEGKPLSDYDPTATMIIYPKVGLNSETLNAQRYLSSVFNDLLNPDEVIKHEMKRTEEMYEEEGIIGENALSGRTFFSKLDEEKKNDCSKWFTKEEVERYIESNYDVPDLETRSPREIIESHVSLNLLTEEQGEEAIRFVDENGVIKDDTDRQRIQALLNAMQDNVIVSALVNIYRPKKSQLIDNALKKIWELDPRTLLYFYSFPSEWEKSGLASKIREKFDLPPFNVDMYAI